MLMLQMTGGLGNQMFQYAMYQELKYRGKEVSIDDFTKYNGQETHSNCIKKVFDLTYERGTREEYNRLTDSSMCFLMRIKRKLFGRKQKLYQEKDALEFFPDVFKLEDAYLIGYYQSEKYFANVAGQLRREFSFVEELITEKAREYRDLIDSSNSVSVHIRRGDYTNEKFAPLYGGICTTEYYKGTMRYLRESLENPRFFLFTNDPDWVRENMNDEDCILVECSDENTGYMDMMLMSRCRHNIIANSSFSWWGAWLNQNPDKIILSPSKWINTTSAEDIYAECMELRFDAKGERVHG